MPRIQNDLRVIRQAFLNRRQFASFYHRRHIGRLAVRIQRLIDQHLIQVEPDNRVVADHHAFRIRHGISDLAHLGETGADRRKKHCRHQQHTKKT